MKVQRSRASAGMCPVGTCRSQASRGPIQAVNGNAIAAQIVDTGKPVIRREGGKVGMGGFLAIRDWAVPNVVFGISSRAQPAGSNTKAGDTAACVVC
jgi:hypothetical protein